MSDFPLSVASSSELHSSGSQPAVQACSDGDEQLGQPPEPASRKASPLHDAEPSQGADGVRRGSGDKHLAASVGDGEQGSGADTPSDSEGCEGPALDNGVDEELGAGGEAVRLQQQDSSVPSPSSVDSGERGSLAPEARIQALGKLHLHGFLGSSEMLSSNEAEDQLG